MTKPLFLTLLVASAFAGFRLGVPKGVAPQPTLEPASPPQVPMPVMETRQTESLNRAMNAGGEAWSKALASASQENPAQLAAWLAAAEFSPNVELGVKSTAEAWAESDPQAALAWSQTLGHPRLLTEALKGLFHRWAQIQPEAAWKAAQNLSPASPEALTAAATAWSQQNFSAAWLASANQPEIQTTLLQNFHPESGIAAPLEKLSQQSDSQLEKLGAQPWINLAQSAPKATMEAWKALPSTSQQKPLILKALAETWVKIDPYSLSLWLQAQPSPKETAAPAIEVLANHLAPSDPEASQRWREMLR